MEKRTFLVTGASKGTGRALSERLAKAGHSVVGIARNKDANFPGALVSADLNDSSSSAAVFDELANRYSFDGVINNAGLVRFHRVGEIKLADVDDILRFNLHPVISAVQALLPSMKAKRWGRIVNISSLTIIGIEQRSAYAASKAALGALT